MTTQARRAIADLVHAGLLWPGALAREMPSPHGRGWTAQLRESGAIVVDQASTLVDVVVDDWGLMHEANQAGALAGRVAGLVDRGVLICQIHPIDVDVRKHSWHIVRHGHFAYYSVEVLVWMMQRLGLDLIDVFEYDLQGGTVLLAFRRQGIASQRAEPVIDRCQSRRPGFDFDSIAALAEDVPATATALGGYLAQCRDAGLRVAGYPASSGVPALLSASGIGRQDLLVIGDASRLKQGRCIPGSRIPIVSPEDLVAARADRVLLFVPGLLAELRRQLPQIESSGGRWVPADPYPVESSSSAVIGRPLPRPADGSAVGGTAPESQDGGGP